MPSVAAFDPFSSELLHPHDFLYSINSTQDRLSRLQCSILGAFAALIGTGIQGLLTVEPQEEVSDEIESVDDGSSETAETVEDQPPRWKRKKPTQRLQQNRSQSRQLQAWMKAPRTMNPLLNRRRIHRSRRMSQKRSKTSWNALARVESELQEKFEVEEDISPRPHVEVPQGSFLGDAFGGMWADIKELAGSVSEGVQEAGRLLTDTEFLGDFVEGATDTVVKTSDYLVNKMTLDDVKEAAGKVANAVETLVDHAIEHPVDTLVEMTPLGDLKCSIDPNKSLGERLVCMGTAVVDLASMASTGGASKGAKVGVNLLQNLEKADDVKDAARVLTRSAMQRTVRNSPLKEESKRSKAPPDDDGYANNSVKCSRVQWFTQPRERNSWMMPMRFHGPMSR